MKIWFPSEDCCGSVCQWVTPEAKDLHGIKLTIDTS